MVAGIFGPIAVGLCLLLVTYIISALLKVLAWGYTAILSLFSENLRKWIEQGFWTMVLILAVNSAAYILLTPMVVLLTGSVAVDLSYPTSFIFNAHLLFVGLIDCVIALTLLCPNALPVARKQDTQKGEL